METLTIQKACLAQAADIKQLIEDSARQLNVEHYTPEQVESALTWIFGVDTQLIEDGTYYVVCDGERVVGCGGWSYRKKDFGSDNRALSDNGMLNPETEMAKIRAFFVHPDYARRGIGKTLLTACENAAKAAGFHRLELVATLTGYTLYSRCGYESAEPLDVQIPDGTIFPCIKMTKSV